MSPVREKDPEKSRPRPAGRSTVVLASASPRRRELLRKIIPRFRVVPSRVDEGQFRDKDPEEFALRAAAAKAEAVGRKNPSSLTVAADTVVVLGAEMFGKPKSRTEARRMLSRLSGREHKVITVVVLYRHRDGRTASGVETSRVTFKTLSSSVIESYLKAVNCLDKAGAYAIQESGDALVERLEGDYDNVVGLPLALLSRLLQRFEKV